MLKGCPHGKKGPQKTFNSCGVEEGCRGALILVCFWQLFIVNCLECAERQRNTKHTNTEETLVLVMLALALPVFEK